MQFHFAQTASIVSPVVKQILHYIIRQWPQKFCLLPGRSIYKSTAHNFASYYAKEEGKKERKKDTVRV